MSRLLEFVGWIAACVASAIVLTVAVDFNPNSTVDITAWLILAMIFMLTATIITTVVVTIVLAVMDARAYYRVTPDAVPPDGLLVRVGLWRCR